MCKIFFLASYQKGPILNWRYEYSSWDLFFANIGDGEGVESLGLKCQEFFPLH